MSYFWPIKDRRESRTIYLCQLLGISAGIFLFTVFNHWRIGYEQCLLGVFVGWFIGAIIYVKFAAEETDTEFDPAPEAEKDNEIRSDTDKKPENLFLIARDADTYRYVRLDDPCLSHFTYFNRCEIDFGESEFEYRVEGTRVFVRLLQDYFDEPGEGRRWSVRDGVVMESDIRSRGDNFLPGSIDEEISDLKKRTDWCEMLLMGVSADLKHSDCSISSHLVGLKYYILSKHLPSAEARRLIRQELERLKLGIQEFTKKAAKLGLGPGGRRGLTPLGGHSWPSSDDFKRLVASVADFGISYREFTSCERIAALLEELLTTVRV
jgi:hypothetical protein